MRLHPNHPPTAPLTESLERGKLRLLRECIDSTDEALLALLNRRAAYSLEIGKIKAGAGSPVFRPAREEQILKKLQEANRGPLRDEHLRAIYREILSASRALQETPKVAFLGPEGTFSHMACLEHLGHALSYAPMPHLKDVFAAVENRECALGAVPLENSVNGSVGATLDLFAEHEVYVQAEWFSRIRLSLVSREASCDAVRVVYSHAQPLGQSAAWLREHCPAAEQVSLESTALAARRAAQEPGSAAVGHAGLAERLGLKVLASGIEDVPDNWTRFFVIGPAPAGEPGANKSSIVFALADKPGSLAQVLNLLAGSGVNMSKLESRPLRGERWKYLFFADLGCDINTPEQAPVLEALRDLCPRLRVLGSYLAGTHAPPRQATENNREKIPCNTM